jgi:hypothetical protein
MAFQMKKGMLAVIRPHEKDERLAYYYMGQVVCSRKTHTTFTWDMSVWHIGNLVPKCRKSATADVLACLDGPVQLTF